MFKEQSKTEKFLIASMSVLLFVFVFNFFQNDSVSIASVAASSEDGKSEASSSSDDQDRSETSTESENDEGSEASESNDDSSGDMSEVGQSESYGVQEGAQGATAAGVGAMTQTTSGETIQNQEMSQEQEWEREQERSMQSNDTEMLEESVMSVEGYDEVMEVEGNKARVRKQEKLFGIFNVDIESEVTLDDSGKIIDEKKGFINWLQDLFSF